MSISRTGECPIFLEYVTKQALVPRAHEPAPDFVALAKYNFHWIDVPSFQRGLVWDEDLLEGLLGSRSVFLGNAILGAFPVPKLSPAFSYLPSGVNQYEVLIDGLQRFSIGTALLSILFPLVLSDTPERAPDAGNFAPLKLQATNWAPVYQHNDYELKNHSRRAVADSYEHFRDRLKAWTDKRFEEGEGSKLAQELTQLFLQRQIAPDVYYGFGSVYEVVNTFIGLNTVRVQLNIVDWLRSVIVDQGGLAGWPPAETERLENRFTETFYRDATPGPEPELIPLASIIKEILTEGEGIDKRRVFPSWESDFSISEVDHFLDFVNMLYEHDSNPFYREIRGCGAIPFASIILYFYRRRLFDAYDASFLKGGDQDDAELHALLRAYYRVSLEGKIARTREFAKRLLLGGENLAEIGDQLSRNFLDKPLDQNVDRDWLVKCLKFADQKRARQVFNACLLPERGSSSVFYPHRYGRSAEDHQIDHMIPASVLDPNKAGGPEGERLMNFAPIRRTTNVKQLNIQCSFKMGPGGVYQVECESKEDAHPYLRWLVEQQGHYASQLDNQELLQTATQPPIAADRIDWIANRILSRI